MISKEKVLENATKKYENYVNYVLRSARTSRKLSGESVAIIEAILEAINTTDYEVDEQEETLEE